MTRLAIFDQLARGYIGISEGPTIWRTGVLFQLKSGLTSAPRLPQTVQVNQAQLIPSVRLDAE